MRYVYVPMPRGERLVNLEPVTAIDFVFLVLGALAILISLRIFINSLRD